VRLVERARFKNSFIFKYSPRRGTKADALFADDVPEEVKRRRNNDLLAVQTAISLTDNRTRIGRTFPVLVEGPSKAAAGRDESGTIGQMTGRTPCDRIVVFEGPARLAGQILPLEIQDVSAVTLFGRVVTTEAVSAWASGPSR
jgi:tRNA-2-methylthio-N6-dimethylallyladenosine synthase